MKNDAGEKIAGRSFRLFDSSSSTTLIGLQVGHTFPSQPSQHAPSRGLCRLHVALDLAYLALTG